MYLVSTFEALMLEFAPLMTAPTFTTFLWLVSGWLFAPRRTVTGCIEAAGVVDRKHHSAFHRFFAAARWSLDELGLTLFELVLPLLGAGATIFLAVDDTLARKRGHKVFGAGMHHDPLLSTRRTRVVNWGHNWVVLGVIMRWPFRRKGYVCLPILFRLYRSKQTVEREGGAYRTCAELAVEMVRAVCGRRPDRRFHLLGDSRYSGKSVVRELPAHCQYTGRLLLDAALYAPAPPRRPGTAGRPRVKGQRLPTPRQMLTGRCRRLTLDLYGRHERVRLSTVQALWYRSSGGRLLRVVVVQSEASGSHPQAFFSTCASAEAVEVLAWYTRRWSIEVGFHEAKGQLGFEEPPGWSPRAVQRTAPLAMLLYGLVLLWYKREGHRQVVFPYRPWYPQKRTASFADLLAALRRQCLERTFLHEVPPAASTQNLICAALLPHARAA